MYFLEGRVERILSDLEHLICTESREITNLQVRYGQVTKPLNPTSIENNWQDYVAGTPWAEAVSDEYALFRTSLEIPAEFRGKKVVLRVKTNKAGWQPLNPQMLIYVNGQEYQGLDRNHHIVLLTDKGQPGATYDVLIHAFSGLGRNFDSDDDGNAVKLFINLETIDPEIEGFYYDLKTALQVVSQLPKASIEQVRLLEVLNETVNQLDLRIPYSKSFYKALQRARDYLQKHVYQRPQTPTGMVTCVGHTHIDVAWLWRYSHTREKVVRSFSTVLQLMEEYPEFGFMSSQPQLYEYIKEDHPHVYARIKERIKEGRWEAEGGMWVEPDVNIPSGESLVRQFLLGKRFFKEEFGVDSRILWLPDVFGYSAALPQIMKKSGVDYFMTAKLRNNEFNEFPYHTFMWRGIDGSEVLSHLTLYCPSFQNALIDKGDIIDSWNNYRHKDFNDDVLLTYGYGDGGGGPTREMVETLKRYEHGFPGVPAARPGKALDYFQELEERVAGNKRLPTWVGELYYEVHRGTYTSMARNKKYNRKAEFLYTTAEWIATLRKLLLGTFYPWEELHNGWKGILLNQFHDVLPGSSIKEVYDDTDEIYHQVFATGEAILTEGMQQIAESIQTDRDALVVFNPLSYLGDGMVEFNYPSTQKVIYLEHPEGSVFPGQRVRGDKYHYIARVSGVEPKGYTTFWIREDGSQDTLDFSSELKVTKERLENRFYRIDLDDQGRISSILDKRLNRQVLQPNQKGNVLQAFEDKPRREDNWNLDIYYSEKMWEINDLQSIEVMESGPVRGVLRITRQFLNSQIKQDLIIYRDNSRIDFKTWMDWQEHDIALKVSFPVEINATQATYEIQYGHVKRNTHWNTSWDIAKFEVCGHKWADLSEYGYGVSLLNDCKYGYDIKDSNMRLTLLRSGNIPNPDADKEIHEFIYSLYPHVGDWRDSGTVRQAYELNCSLLGQVIEAQPKGTLPPSYSMVRISSDNVIVEVVKQAEDGQDTVLRVYEAYNQRALVKLELGEEIEDVKECNLMEEDLSCQPHDLKWQGREFTFSIQPFEIRTFKVSWAK